jgi:hypothetical protein
MTRSWGNGSGLPHKKNDLKAGPGHYFHVELEVQLSLHSRKHLHQCGLIPRVKVDVCTLQQKTVRSTLGCLQVLNALLRGSANPCSGQTDYFQGPRDNPSAPPRKVLPDVLYQR